MHFRCVSNPPLILMRLRTLECFSGLEPEVKITVPTEVTVNACTIIYAYQIEIEENIKRHLENRDEGLIFLFQLFSTTLLLFPWYYCLDTLSLFIKSCSK